MANHSWKSKRDALYGLSKAVSELYGRDDPAFLQEHMRHVILEYKDALDEAIECYKGILEGHGRALNVDPPAPREIDICKCCGYVPPFCYYNRDGFCSNVSQKKL